VRLCRVIGSVVATVKHPTHAGESLMIVQPIDHTGADSGTSFLAFDRAQAGPGDRVLVLREGNGVRQILGKGDIVPIRSLIVGIVDQVDVPAEASPAGDATHATAGGRSRRRTGEPGDGGKQAARAAKP
jgi:ethanolamine utilization protein EutN